MVGPKNYLKFSRILIHSNNFVCSTYILTSKALCRAIKRFTWLNLRQ